MKPGAQIPESQKALPLVLLVAVLLATGTLCAYLPVLGMDFTNYDDPDYVTENPAVRSGLTTGGSAWAFSNFHSGNWHPLTWLSHMLDCTIFGLNAAGHHFTNVLFHAANTAILFFLFRSLTGALWRSALVAALFGLHPLHVESVAWVAERKDVLSGFFGLLTIWAYAKHTQYKVQSSKARTDGAQAHLDPAASRQGTCGARPSLGAAGHDGKEPMKGPGAGPPLNIAAPGDGRTPEAVSGYADGARWYYGLAFLLFTLGLMSKPMLVTLPFVLLLLDYWPLGRFQFRDQGHGATDARGIVILEKIPFFALSAVSCWVTFLAQKSSGAVASLHAIPLGDRIINALVSYGRYLAKIVCPTNLAVIYPAELHWGIGAILLSTVVLAGLTALALWQLQRRPYLVVGWAWFVGMLVPVIGIVQVGNQSMADRYTYLPAIGLFVVLSWGGGEIVRRTDGGTLLKWTSVIPSLAAGVVLVACALLTERQLSYWRNTETLFRHAVAAARNNFVAYNSLGFYYTDRHEVVAAEKCFRSALAINPANPFSWSGLARVSLDQGKYDEAIADCQAALTRNPGLADVQASFGMALSKKGQMDEAISHYREALRLRPNHGATHYNLANALAARGQIEAAREHYEESLKFDPASADAHNNLAYMLVREGKLDEATKEFRSALALQPSLWQGRFGLADALDRQGKGHEAIEQYQEVIRSKPDFVPALDRLAWILATHPEGALRNGSQAVALAEEACRITQHQQPLNLLTLAAALAEAGRFAEAVPIAEKADSIARGKGNSKVSQRIEMMLELFRAGRPYRENRVMNKED